MPDQPMQDLFEITQPLAEIGRGTHQQQTRTPRRVLGRPEFVRVVFDDFPRVSTRPLPAEIDRLMAVALDLAGMLTERGGNRFAVELEEALRRASREELDLVYPYRLLRWFELAGVGLEPVDLARVFAGHELIGGIVHREFGPLERRADPVTDAAARCLELHEVALAAIRTPRYGPASGVRSGGQSRLAWRLAKGEGAVVEVAARIELDEATVSVRGSYAIGGPDAEPGFRFRPEASELVAGVERTASSERAVFWLTGEALKAAIVTFHARVIAEALHGRSEG